MCAFARVYIGSERILIRLFENLNSSRYTMYVEFSDVRMYNISALRIVIHKYITRNVDIGYRFPYY